MPHKRTRDASNPKLNAQHRDKVPFPVQADEPSRGQKRKRQVRIIVDEPESEPEEAASEEEEEEEEEEEPRPAWHLRSADVGPATSDEEELEEETELEDEIEEDVSEPESDVSMTGHDDRYHIEDAPAPVLRRLRRDELARLFVVATGEPRSSTAHLTKEPLVQHIIDARTPDVPPADEDSDDAHSPSTSQTASPPRAGTGKAKSAAAASQRRATRRHVPTPPPSSGSEHESTDDDADDSVIIVEDDSIIIVEEPRALKGRSQSLPNASAQPNQPRTRRGVKADLEGRVVRLRNGKSVLPPASRRKAKPVSNPSEEPAGSGSDEDEDEDEDDVENPHESEEEDEEAPEEELEAVASTSGPAYRTRTRASSIHSPPARPSRAAKGKAMARLATKSLKGKEKALDQDQDTNSDDEDDEDVIAPNDDDSAEEDEESEEDAEMREATPRRPTRPTATRRGGRKVQQVETPPSDADDESGEEQSDAEAEAENLDDEESEEVQIALVRELRNGKVVQLAAPEEEDSEDAMSTSDAADEPERDEEEQGDGEDDVDLEHATSKSLLRCRRDDLVRLCEDRQLDGDGTKRELVNQLLNWRELNGSDDSSGHSTASANSNATARGETKTQALNALPPTSATDLATPLLMQSHHSPDPNKVRTPEVSKADEQEEVNALDLESLQLQDKAIMPEKLTRLEKIGSGGFKDVYKGIYRKKTIAIADIRGHLTDMDIKEIGLLRDLRHPNIVNFIGVSIPKEPTTVPVMIVTELCSNGDLFDYLRADHPVPTFRVVIDIMLGISKGVEYLHTRTPAIIHRDIKSSNVLITQQGVAKINDFGLARVKTSTRSMIRSLVGTVNWQAPELWVPHPRYNEKVDVYSVGLVFWEILQWHQPVKRYPFEGMNEHAIYDSVGQKNIRPSTASIGRTWGAEILNLINVMWQGDHSQRPSMAAVVAELEIIKSSLAPEEKKSRR
ncbi:hypothetical protein RQP46_000813 [Phenoliferia psychrophenolica]